MRSNTGWIIGGVIGVVAGVAVLAVGILFAFGALRGEATGERSAGTTPRSATPSRTSAAGTGRVQAGGV